MEYLTNWMVTKCIIATLQWHRVTRARTRTSTHAHTHANAQARTHTHTHTHTHACTHTHTCTHTYTHTRTHTHTATHTPTHASAHAHTRTRTHAHTYTHIHTHAHTYTHIHTHSLKLSTVVGKIFGMRFNACLHCVDLQEHMKITRRCYWGGVPFMLTVTLKTLDLIVLRQGILHRLP